MTFIRLLFAPLRRLLGFPLVQLAIAIAVILFLQAADSQSITGRLFAALDALVDSSVQLAAHLFEVKSFTRSWLVAGFMIAYVYLAWLALLFLARLFTGLVVERVARHNALGLRSTIARDRGIAAYQAWLPLERIRPADISQEVWEERYAWPADNQPPYHPLWRRALRAILAYTAFAVVVICLLQAFTPFPVISWVISWLRAYVW
jgi:hypothetical protein